jgi:hypothetical protein
MTTKSGVALLFNKNLGYVSSDPQAVIAALSEDMKGKDEIASKMAREIYIHASFYGGIKNLNSAF